MGLDLNNVLILMVVLQSYGIGHAVIRGCFGPTSCQYLASCCEGNYYRKPSFHHLQSGSRYIHHGIPPHLEKLELLIATSVTWWSQDRSQPVKLHNSVWQNGLFLAMSQSVPQNQAYCLHYRACHDMIMTVLFRNKLVYMSQSFISEKQVSSGMNNMLSQSN